MSKFKFYFMWLLAVSVIFLGIREFDQATHWIPLFKGLFWMFVGAFSLWQIPSKDTL